MNDFRDFNINKRTLKRLIPFLLLITALSVSRINFGYSIICLVLIWPINTYLTRLITAENSGDNIDNLPKKFNDNSIGYRISITIGIALVIILIAGIPFYGPLVQNFLIETLKINPDTALNSIRSFIGLKEFKE